MIQKDASTKNDEVLSLGMAALIGKAINDKAVLDALVEAKGNKEQLARAAREKACIDLNDCDLDGLLEVEIRDKGLTIIDLINIARKCLKENEPDVEDKVRG